MTPSSFRLFKGNHTGFVLTRKHLQEKNKKKRKTENRCCAGLWLRDLDQLKQGREEEQEDINAASGQFVWWPLNATLFKNAIFDENKMHLTTQCIFIYFFQSGYSEACEPFTITFNDFVFCAVKCSQLDQVNAKKTIAK